MTLISLDVKASERDAYFLDSVLAHRVKKLPEGFCGRRKGTFLGRPLTPEEGECSGDIFANIRIPVSIILASPKPEIELATYSTREDQPSEVPCLAQHPGKRGIR